MFGFGNWQKQDELPVGTELKDPDGYYVVVSSVLDDGRNLRIEYPSGYTTTITRDTAIRWKANVEEWKQQREFAKRYGFKWVEEEEV